MPAHGGPGDESTPVSLADMVGHYKRSKFLAEQEVLRLVAEGESSADTGSGGECWNLPLHESATPDGERQLREALRVLSAKGLVGARPAEGEEVIGADRQAGRASLAQIGREQGVDMGAAFGRLDDGESDIIGRHARPVDLSLMVGDVDAPDREFRAVR